ncbi:MAG: ATP-binding cassette domain-containing protein [Burkholderiales bacterium]
MITLRKVSLRRGAKLLLEGVDAAIHPGERVGLVGPNGCGKSSLFALLQDELHVDAGDVELPPGWVVAHVAQEAFGLDRPAIEFVMDGDAELRRIASDLARAEAGGDGEEIAHAHEAYAHVEGYAARARAAALLDGLGFAQDDFARRVGEFSGGWRMRLNLARTLMCRSDLLLLDEPTNHLDLDAVVWLEGWLAGYRGTLIVVSHDREFLDAVATTILHVDGRRLRRYSGNYSAFEGQRAAQLANEQALYARQQREVARLERFVERFRAKATKARQAQSRIKALERMELIAPAHVDSPFAFHFREFPGSPDPVLVLEDAAAGYDGAPVLSDVKLTIQAGARIGLLGRNGAGKTTLVKLLAGRLPPLAGDRREGKNLRVGYFAQHTLEVLRPEDSPLQHFVRVDPRAREQVLRDFLGGFDFSGDMALAPVANFSGGEKARLALALIVWQQPNLLLLDEPTNHLDLDMREALALALQEFEGAMVLVSHDRHLLRTATDSLMLVADGRLAAFDGDLDDYRAWLEGKRSGEKAKSGAGSLRREQKRAEAEARQALARTRKPLETKLKALEAEIARLERDKRALEAKLAAEGFYASGDQDEVTAALREQAKLALALEKAESQWLELQEKLEAIG